MKFLKLNFRRPARSNERGVTIIENLIALSILTVIVASNSRFILLSMKMNQNTRSYMSLASDAQQIIDNYRNGPYSDLLDNFGGSYSAIEDGETANEETHSSNARADFNTTFTAVKTSNTAFPEAVRVQVEATQRRGTLGSATYTFETIITQVGS